MGNDSDGKYAILTKFSYRTLKFKFTSGVSVSRVTPIGRSYHFRSPTTGCPPRVIASLCASAPGAAGLDTSQILEPLTQGLLTYQDKDRFSIFKNDHCHAFEKKAVYSAME